MATIVKVRKHEPSPEILTLPDLLEDIAEVTLKLTANEAKAFLLVASRVGGSPDSTLRGEIESIRRAMINALAEVWSAKHPTRPANSPRIDARYLNGAGVVQGHIEFTKGGRHI